MTAVKIRLFVEDDLAAEAPLCIAGRQANHMAQVLRLGPGDSVALFNGRDGEWLGRIDAAGRKACAVTAVHCLRQQPTEPNLTLAFAPVKKTGTDFIVEKATELGVSHLVPVFTEHTATNRVNVERLRINATEAAQQCGRLSVPEVTIAQRLDDFLKAWPATAPLLLADETGSGRRLADVLSEFAEPGANLAHGLLIGPEGGFAADELAGLRAISFVRFIDLGPRILRAETAAIAALACWQALVGDWRRRETGLNE